MWAPISEPFSRTQTLISFPGAYYGEGYQDVQNRVPAIDNTMSELGWKPTTTMSDALKNIFEAYRGDVEKARHLVDKE